MGQAIEELLGVGIRISPRINEDLALIKFALNELHFIEIIEDRSLDLLWLYSNYQISTFFSKTLSFLVIWGIGYSWDCLFKLFPFRYYIHCFRIYKTHIKHNFRTPYVRKMKEIKIQVSPNKSPTWLTITYTFISLTVSSTA